MATIGELIINLRAKTESFVSDLDRVKNLSFDTAKQTARSLNIIGTAAVGVIGTLVAAGAAAIESGIKIAAAMEHAGEKVGLTAGQFSALSFAAKQVAIDQDTLQTALARLAKNAASAAEGGKQQKEAFDRVGVSVKGAHGALLPMQDLLLNVADKFSKMKDGTGKTAEAMQLFGRAGQQMIPFLNLGREGIQAFTKQAADLGLVMDEKTAKGAVHLEQQMQVLSARFTGAKIKILTDLMPTLEKLADVLQESLGKSPNFNWISEMVKQFVAAGADMILIAKLVNASVNSIGSSVMKPYEHARSGYEHFKAGAGPSGEEKKAESESFSDYFEKAKKQHDDFIKLLSAPVLPNPISTGQFKLPAGVKEQTARFLEGLSGEQFVNLQKQAEAAHISFMKFADGLAAAQKAATDPAFDGAKDAHDRLEKSIQKTIAALRLEVETFGKSKFEIEDAKREEEGWTASQRETARALEHRRDLLQANVDWTKRLAEAQKAAKATALDQQIKTSLDQLDKFGAAGDQARIGKILASPLPQISAGPNLQADIATRIEEIRKQYQGMISDFGKSDIQKMVEQLQQLGATPEQIASVRGLAEQLEHLEATAPRVGAAFEAMKSASLKIFEDLTSGSHNFRKTLLDIEKQIVQMTLKIALFGTSGKGGLLGGFEHRAADILGGANRRQTGVISELPEAHKGGPLGGFFSKFFGGTGKAGPTGAAGDPIHVTTSGTSDLLGGLGKPGSATTPPWLAQKLPLPGAEEGGSSDDSSGSSSFGQIFQSIAGRIGSMFSKIASSFGSIFGKLFGAIGLHGFAEGGRTSAGVPILVGEQGPEVFNPDRSGEVIPHSDIAGAGGSEGGRTVKQYTFVQHVHGVSDFDSFKRSQNQIRSGAFRQMRFAEARNG